MRILAMSDIHGHFGVYEWMVHVVETNEIDLLVLAGDLLGGHGDELTIEDAQRREAERVVRILRKLSIPVVYIMGNDDQVSLEADDAAFLPIHGRHVKCGDFSFLGYQYSPPFMGGIFEKPEEEISKEVQSLEPLLSDRTVFVTHSPAKGILDWTTLNGHVGSSSIRDAISRNPMRAHIHGHIHGSFGRQGKHFNVASAWQYRGMVIDLNDLSHEVVTQLAL
jgi:Icc-related predicted phosphoesterase